MALVSPGVQVNVIDESFYTPAEPGTVPLIFVATKENKTNPGNTGIAPGTLKSNAGKVYLISSQRELSETFGDPLFYTDANNNPIHGGEQNEYGLQAAYSYLGVANRAYIVRADVDLNSITASSTPVTGDPTNNSYWFDTDASFYGVFEWNGAAITTTNGQSFLNKVPLVITDTTKVVDYAGGNYTPKGSVGVIGDYAMVAVTDVNTLWYKNRLGTWVKVGTPEWKASHAIVTGANANPTLIVGRTITFSLTSDSTGNQYNVTTSGATIASLASAINANTALVTAGITASVVNSRLAIFYSGASGDTVELYGDDATFTLLGISQGDYYAPKLEIAPHTSVPEFKTTDTNPRPTGSLWAKTTTPNLGANWSIKRYSSDTASWTTIPASIYATNTAAIYGLDSTGGGANLVEGQLYIQSNVAEDGDKLATFKLFRRNSSGETSITSAKVTASSFPAGTHSFSLTETLAGESATTTMTVSFVATGATSDADVLANAINAKGYTHVSASVNAQNRVVISHTTGGDIRFVDTSGILDNVFTPYVSTDPTSTTNFYYAPGTDQNTSPKEFIATLWKVLTYTAQTSEPTTTPAQDALWYSSVIDEVDILYHNGTTWVGYKDNATAFPNTDPNGPIVSATEPTEQSDGSALVTNDLWISTADIENYPTVYRYNATTSKWTLVDKTDQTTENGILFADARWSTAGTSENAADIVDLLESNYLDADAPDPALYPKGMLLWNLRRSGFNVKRFERNYVDIEGTNTRYNDESMTNYYPHRWVTESANNIDGSGSFGRNAQRKVVVQSLQASVNSNEDIRDDESRIFNLIASPGYPELIGEMINLNYDRGLTAFVVGDSPMRLQPNTTSINNWASNVALAVEDNDLGLVSRDEYLGVYYPAGFTSDNAGNNIVVPPSHMALRVIALNDQVAYPWFAPAGTRRGGVTNASAVGYISNEGEFVSISLNEGQRDTLYQANVNPITFLNGAGLVVFGQKTRARNASALDRINVARLVIYLRSQLKKLAKPYIFEPNDKITRDEIKQQVESLMVELIGLRAIYDYLVVCDETNNTPARIDRNELYVDIAIEPVKAIEFIYIPLRLKNTGEIAGL
jgi:hypothetical protein